MPALRKGRAFGAFTGSREYLTILGSAYRRPGFYPAPRWKRTRPARART